MSQRINEIVSICSNLIGDLTVAVEVLRDFESKSALSPVKRQAVWRLCFFSIIMNCRKYVEVCEKYGAELNKEIPDIKVFKGKYVEEINRNSAIADLRNHYVAHVQKKSEKRALSDEEVQNYILSMVGGDNASEFINWICPDDFEKSNREDSLVGVIEIIRDKVVKRYNKN